MSTTEHHMPREEEAHCMQEVAFEMYDRARAVEFLTDYAKHTSSPIIVDAARDAIKFIFHDFMFDAAICCGNDSDELKELIAMQEKALNEFEEAINANRNL